LIACILLHSRSFIETDTEAVSRDNFTCFSERIFIRLTTRIMQIVIAKSLPKNEIK